jgi:hypothetical protein
MLTGHAVGLLFSFLRLSMLNANTENVFIPNSQFLQAHVHFLVLIMTAAGLIAAHVVGLADLVISCQKKENVWIHQSSPF